MEIDKKQGITEEGGDFGYIAGDGGGWFFTWYDDPGETLNSIEIDETDGNGGISEDEAREALEKIL